MKKYCVIYGYGLYISQIGNADNPECLIMELETELLSNKYVEEKIKAVLEERFKKRIADRTIEFLSVNLVSINAL